MHGQTKMKILMSAIALACLSVFTGSAQDKSWRFGPYDKFLPPKPSGLVFTSQPPPAVRGAMIPSKTATNSLSLGGTKRL
jgi:hypothetical protein